MSLETLTIAESRFFAKSNLFDQSLNSPKVQIWREHGDVSDDERQEIKDWIGKQPISATVRVTDLINFEDTDVGKRLDGPSFGFNNLSDEDQELVLNEQRRESETQP